MRFSIALAVALNTAILVMLAGCGSGPEREYDGVDVSGQQGDCPCTMKAVLEVNSLHGGTITCKGESWTFEEGATISPICLDNHGFTLSVQASGEAWLDVVREDGDPAELEFSMPVTPPDWPAQPSDFVHLPDGGTVTVTVPD